MGVEILLCKCENSALISELSDSPEALPVDISESLTETLEDDSTVSEREEVGEGEGD